MRVLAVAAHPDDIELGCGGALLRHQANGDELMFLVMTGGEATGDGGARFQEQRRSARLFGADLRWGKYVDGSIPTDARSVGLVDGIVNEFQPDVVYVNCGDDSHQDHRATAEVTIASARRVNTVLLYETPSTLRFTPSVYVDIDAFLPTKMAALRNHDSQVSRVGGPVDLDAVEAQARYRGFQARGSFAEAFELVRLRWLDDIEIQPDPLPNVVSIFDTLEIAPGSTH